MNPLASTSPGPSSPDTTEGHAPKVAVPHAWLHDAIQCRSTIKRLAARAYPSYRGRTFRVEYRETYLMQNYWDGGTKYYCMGVDLATERIFSPHADTTTPFNKVAGSEFEIPPGFAIIELCILQGKSLGISLILSPRTLQGGLSV